MPSCELICSPIHIFYFYPVYNYIDVISPTIFYDVFNIYAQKLISNSLAIEYTEYQVLKIKVVGIR